MTARSCASLMVFQLGVPLPSLLTCSDGVTPLPSADASKILPTKQRATIPGNRQLRPTDICSTSNASATTSSSAKPLSHIHAQHVIEQALLRLGDEAVADARERDLL